MTRTRRRYTSLLVLSLTVALLPVMVPHALAAEANGGVPGDWLSRYMGARTAGLGGAFVAAGDEPIGVVWNPAALSRMSQNELHLETGVLFESTSLNALSFAVPARRFPSLGLTIVNLRSGDFDRTNELNESMGTFNESDMAFIFSASKNLGRRVSLGTNVRVVRQALDEFDAAGVGFDLGVLYDITPAVRVGASVLNIGGPNLELRTTQETFPTEFRGGLAVRVMNGRGLFSAEIDHRAGPGATFHGGSEFWLHRSMSLRLGYADNNPTGGFSYRVSPDVRFDYGASDHELGVTHRFAVSYRFGGFFASSQAVPTVFSPIGERSVTKFHLKAKTKADTQSWTLQIMDKSSQIVRVFSGSGVPPAHVMWDGKDENGLPLPDGVYRYTLSVVDAEGRQVRAHERTVEITTEGPQGAVPVFTD